MTTIGKSLSIKGELHAAEDLTLEGRVEGPVWCEEGTVIVQATAGVAGDIIARDITVSGRIQGQLIATDVVDVRAHAAVNGDIVSRRFILDPDAEFNGRAQPQHLDAALRVRKYRQQQRNAGLVTP